MRAAYEADQIRAAEAPLLAAGVPLMRQAARALAIHAKRHHRLRAAAGLPSRILVLVGGGNNGGDGLWAAAELARAGIPVDVLLATENPHASGLAAARDAGLRPHTDAEAAEVTRLADAAGIWLDALAGIGLRGAPRGRLAALLDLLAARRDAARRANLRPHVIAVDTPSGLVDDPAATHALAADETLTFGAPTPALLLPPARRLAGRVIVANLGIPLAGEPAVLQVQDADVAAHWPRAEHLDHKYTRGVLAVLAGSAEYPGAGLLATSAALAAGPGMIRYVGEGEVARLVVSSLPEVVTVPGRVQAALIGPGTTGGHAVAAAIAHYSAMDVPLVLDAGALTCLGSVPSGEGPVRRVLTPHAGELADLLGVARRDVESDPVTHAREAARREHAVVVAKGPETVILAPTGPVYTIPNASPWLATAGSGDCLAGVIAAALAAWKARAEAGRDVPPLAEQVALATLVHGRAADACGSAPGPLRAHDLPDAIARTLAALLVGPQEEA
ncbi:MAG: NAD(P)H-hydrate dehydratase [Bowdeniella nasicola]|nr:NAD(P)H-hydrate dehydratase [Bowdeniella nasicola]